MKNKLIKNTLLLSMGGFGIKLLGLGRDLLIAAFFGVAAEVDAFFVALAVPSIFVSILGNALTNSFTPVYFRYRENAKDEERYEFLANLTTCITVFFLVLGIAVLISAPLMVKLLAPGFSTSLAKFAIGLVRLFAILTVLTGLGVFLKAPAQCENRFGWTVLSDIILNGMILIAGLLLCRVLGIYGLAFAYIIGAIFQVVILGLRYFKDKGRLRTRIDFSEPGLREVFRLSLPLYLGLITANISNIIDKAMASGLPTGTISALTYANKIRQFPIIFLGSALVTALFPTLSRLVTLNQREQILTLTNKVTKIILTAGLYIVNMVLLLSVPITAFLFERGNFEREATIITSEALIFYALSIPAMALGMLLVRVYHAHKDTKTTVIIGMASIIVNITLNLILIGPMAHKGIALATAIAQWLACILLIHYLKRKHQITLIQRTPDNVWFLVKLIAINLVVYLIGTQVISLLQNVVNEVIILCTVAAIGGVCYLVGIFISGIDRTLGLDDVFKKINNKLRRGTS